MTKKKKEEIVIFQADDLKGVVMSWVKDSTSNPGDYLTKNGLAFVNGYAQANNSIGLIKQEKYDELTDQFEELVSKYDNLLKENKELIKVGVKHYDDLETLKVYYNQLVTKYNKKSLWYDIKRLFK